MNWMREPDTEPISGYRLIEPLGSGGFGEVWKCEAPGGLYKAIKFVYGNLNSLDIDAVRAEQELHALERIREVRHPFVCSLDRIEVANGELVIVMELCDKTLHDVFKEHQAAGLIGIPRGDLLRYMRDAAEALDYMNEKHKLQHLDVKPRNLFLVGDRVKVADFGLVKHLERLTASGLLGGVTPLYSSPETFNGKISESSDQYSLAIVYQEMLTGHRPYTGKNVRQMAQQHLQAQPDLRALPESERPLIARALSKNPAERFPNCMALVGSLFKARAAISSSLPKKESVLVGDSQRPKTLVETFEDIFISDPPVDVQDEDQVDLAGPASSGEENGRRLEVSELGATLAQPSTGTLRPTLFIGVGSFGRKGLLELRCRFMDRFGDLSKIPLFRFLCLDPDPEAVNTAVKGAPDVALSRHQVHHLPLQPVTNYRKRIIEQLSEWLPREKLYAMPRSLQPQGSRALGRLAFVDNHQRLLARIRREIQDMTSPEIIYQSVSQTGLALRDAIPRIYLVASAGGGSSGLLVDLCYALRRQLAHMRHPDAEINLLLLCSAPTDPASPKSELANVYATLTEINHFNDPTIPFAAEYGVEGQRIVDQGTPANSIYLLPLPHRGSEAVEDAIAHLGSYLFHEVTTPLGAHLSSLRKGSRSSRESRDVLATPFRSFGTYAVWFPRGLLLRFAARLACRRLVDHWLEPAETIGFNADSTEIERVCDLIIAELDFTPEALMHRIEEAARSAKLTDLGATPGEAVTALLATLEEQSFQAVAQEDPGNWARQAFLRVQEWVGDATTVHMQQWRKTRVNRALHLAVKSVAERYAKELMRRYGSVMQNPGARVAAAECAISRLRSFCQKKTAAQKDALALFQTKTQQIWDQLDIAVADCMSGGNTLRWFGGKSNRRILGSFVEHLSQFAHARVQEEMAAAVQEFFGSLRAQLEEQKRDLGFCRQRLRHLRENLDMPPAEVDEDITATRPGAEVTLSHSPVASTESYWEAIRCSKTARVLLPDNEQELEKAAVNLLHRLGPRDWVHIDKEIHDLILEPRGGLFSSCMKSVDLTRGLAAPLLEEMIRLLNDYLPPMDVAEILAKEFGFVLNNEDSARTSPAPLEIADKTKKYLHRAMPELRRQDESEQHCFLLIPASAAGKGLSEAMEKELSELRHVKVAGQSDLMFCCDQGSLLWRDLRETFKMCQQAYEQNVMSPQSSPHARFDIVDWTPLDP